MEIHCAFVLLSHRRHHSCPLDRMISTNDNPAWLHRSKISLENALKPTLVVKKCMYFGWTIDKEAWWRRMNWTRQCAEFAGYPDSRPSPLCFVSPLLQCHCKLTWHSSAQTPAWAESWSPAAPGQRVRGPATPLTGEYKPARPTLSTPPTRSRHTPLPSKHSEIIMHSIICSSSLSGTQ